GKTRYLLRDLTLEHGLDEVGSEELAQAVHLSTVALLEGQLSTTREQVERSLQDAAPADATASPSTASSSPTPRTDVTPPASSVTRPQQVALPKEDVRGARSDA